MKNNTKDHHFDSGGDPSHITESKVQEDIKEGSTFYQVMLLIFKGPFMKLLEQILYI